MKFKLCLIGAGNIARAHVAAVEDLKADGSGVQITAIVDPVESARTALAHDTRATGYDNLGDLLAKGPHDARPDALVVCTPPSARIEAVRQALEAGIPVLIEKPPAHTVAHTQQLIALSRAAPKLPCVVGFCHRFTPAVDMMVQRFNDGLIGEAVRFENTFAANLPHLRDAWMSDPAVSGGGSLIDTGLHSIDLFRYLLGPARVEGAVLRRGWAGRGESNATLLLSSTTGEGRLANPGGVAGTLACGWAETTRFEVNLVGTQGSLRYDFDDPCALHHTAVDGSRQALTVETHEARFTGQLKAFIEFCRSGNADPRLCEIAPSLDAMQLVAEADRFDEARQRQRETEPLTPQIVQRTPVAPAADAVH